jgi:hypothetical protein
MTIVFRNKTILVLGRDFLVPGLVAFADGLLFSVHGSM